MNRTTDFDTTELIRLFWQALLNLKRCKIGPLLWATWIIFYEAPSSTSSTVAQSASAPVDQVLARPAAPARTCHSYLTQTKVPSLWANYANYREEKGKGGERWGKMSGGREGGGRKEKGRRKESRVEGDSVCRQHKQLPSCKASSLQYPLRKSPTEQQIFPLWFSSNIIWMVYGSWGPVKEIS